MWAGLESVHLFPSILPFVSLSLMWENSTKGRNWDNHTDLCAEICEGKYDTQAISDFQCHRRCDEFAGALHGKQVCLSSPVPLHCTSTNVEGSSSQGPAFLPAPTLPEPWQPKGGWEVSQQSKQTDQKWISPPEISRQIKINLPVGKSAAVESAFTTLLRAVPAHSAYPTPASSAPVNPETGDVRCYGWAEAQRRPCTASVAPRKGMKPYWKPGSAKASHKTEHQIHHKWSSLLCLPRGSNINFYKEMVQSPTFIPRAQSHLDVYTAPKISTSQ